MAIFFILGLLILIIGYAIAYISTIDELTSTLDNIMFGVGEFFLICIMLGIVYSSGYSDGEIAQLKHKGSFYADTSYNSSIIKINGKDKKIYYIRDIEYKRKTRK